MTIYEIDKAILECIDREKEIVDFDALDKLQMEREKKIENIACWRKNFVASAEVKTLEVIRLRDKASNDLANADRLDAYLVALLDGKSFETARCKISFVESTETVIEDIGKIPLSLLREKVELQPKEKAIKAKILSGEAVAGAYVSTRSHIYVD